MNLTIYENKVISSLPVKHQEFLQAKFSPTIKTFKDIDLADQLTDLIQITLISSGIKDQSDERVARYLKDTMFEDLKSPKFNHLTFAEVKQAFSNGVRLEYGQYMGINITTLHSWLRAYTADKRREEAIKEFNRKLTEEETATKPVYFTKEHFIKAAKTAFSDYKKDGSMPMIPFAIYDTIKELIGAKTLIEQKDWEEVKNEAKQTYSNQMNRTNLKRKMKLDFTLGNASFENHVKNVGLRRFFDNLIKENKELEL